MIPSLFSDFEYYYNRSQLPKSHYSLDQKLVFPRIYNLESGEFASTPPFSKKAFGGNNFGGHFWREIFGGNFSKTHLVGKFKKPFGGKILKVKFWWANFGRNT